MRLLRHLNTSTSQLYVYKLPEYLIRSAIYISLFVAIFHLGALTLLTNLLPSIFLDIVLITLLVVMVLLLRLGHIEFAKQLFLLTIWLYITAGTIMFGGIRNPLFGSFNVLILFAALLAGRRSLVLYTVLGAISGIVITMMQTRGYVGHIDYVDDPVYSFVGMMANMGASFALIYLTFQWIQSVLMGGEQARSEYDREHLLLRTLVDAMPEGVFIKNMQQKIILANRSFASFANSSTDLMIDKDIANLQTPTMRALSKQMRSVNPEDSALIAREFHVEEIDRWFTLTQAGIRGENGKLSGSIGILTDITAQKRLENALRHTTEQERILKEKQRIVNEVIIVLSRVDNLNELCRLAIVYGREKLGFDRLGLFLFDPKTQQISGTWGTDPTGELRDERYVERLIATDDVIQQMMESKGRVKFFRDIPLFDNRVQVGTGWNAMAVLWDGDQGIGWLATDNLIKQETFDERQIDILAQYSTALGHLVARLQAVDQLRESQVVLQIKSDSLSALAKISELVHSSLNPDDFVKTAVHALTEHLGVKSTIYYAIDRANNQLVSVYQSGVSDSLAPAVSRLSIDDSFSGLAVTQKSVMISSFVGDDPRINEYSRVELQRAGIHRIVSIPIIDDTEVVGLISLAFYRMTQDLDVEYTAYQAIGRTLGLAMGNARVAKQIRLERDLADLVVDSIPGLFFILDDKGLVQRLNSNFVRESGMSPVDLLHKPLTSLFPKQHDAFQQMIDTTLQDGEMSLSVLLEVADDVVKPYLFTMRLYQRQDTRGMICIGLDISDRIRLTETIEHRATQLQVAGTISKTIAAVLDTQSALQQSVDLICSSFDYYYVGAFLVDFENEYAVLHAGSGDAGRAMRESNHRLKIGGQSMIGQSIKHRRAEITSNVAETTVHYVNPHLPDTRSELAIPIIHRHHCLGAFTVQSTEINAFSEEDVTVIQFIADHLASTLENARLYNIISRRQRYLGTLRRVSNRVAPERDEKRFLEGVVKTLVEEFHYQSVQFLLADPERRELRIASTSSSIIVDNYQDHTQSFDVGIFGWVASNRLAYLSVDCNNDPKFNRLMLNVEIGSELAVPVMHYGEIFGVLAISAKEPFALDELDLEMMGEFSIELATHLENIRLFGQVQQNAIELEHRVDERTSQLKAVNHELEAFSYSVSHDLRSPLRSIDGFSQALLEDYYDVLDETGQEFLTRIRTATQRMGQLIDDLLTLSRVTRKELLIQDVNLSEFADEIITTLRINHPERIIETLIQPDIILQGDPRLLKIMLENLLGNAWKFTSRTENAKIEFLTEEINNRKTLIIRDNGVGFNMKYADKLFGAFQRLHVSNQFEGTGIGLATVYRIVQRHNGSIWAESEEGSGASFFIVLID